MTVTNSVDIFVERALYWNVDGVVWAGGTSAAAAALTDAGLPPPSVL